MKLSIGIACFNQLGDTKGVWGNLIANTALKDEVELVVVDNGCTDDTVKFLNDFVFPRFPNHKLIQNPQNIGVVKALDQIHRQSTGEIIAIPHNDVNIFQYGWDKWVLQEFEADPKLGLAGFLGALGIAHNGGRHETMSNMLEAEYHGKRITEVKDVVGFDGLCLIPRRVMLDEIGGFDLNYDPHHFYDRDLSLASYHQGWKNKIIPVYCHHISGITANRPDYANWAAQKLGVEVGKGDQEVYMRSQAYFFQKWNHYLSRMIGNEPQECQVCKIPVK